MSNKYISQLMLSKGPSNIICSVSLNFLIFSDFLSPHHLDAFNPGVGIGGELGDGRLLLNCLGVNCSKCSLSTEIDI